MLGSYEYLRGAGALKTVFKVFTLLIWFLLKRSEVGSNSLLNLIGCGCTGQKKQSGSEKSRRT